MATRTSKSLAERIDINYWKKPHPLRRRKWVAGLVAGGIGLLWLFWNAVCGDQRIYQSGTLAPVHAMVQRDCGRCHTAAWQPMLRLVTGDTRRRSTPDAACSHCHEGPIHHEQQVASDVPPCATCHREHRGLTDLTRVPDAHCTGCHADLKTTSGAPHTEPHIASFATDHPEFAVLRKREPDRASIKLNHAVHMKAEGVLTNAGSVEVLTCASCHRPDSDRRLMLPIDHETHCSRCHSNARMFDTERFADRPAPHQDPETVRALVRDRYSEFVRDHPETFDDENRSRSDRRVPGRPNNQLMTKAEWDWVQQKTESAERVLFEGAGGCRFCHEVARGESGWAVTRPEIPARWLSKSQFRHDSHRMLACTACHPAQSSTQTSDVLLPPIESCRSCHAPTRGARNDCTECHTYHDKTHERWGVSAL